MSIKGYLVSVKGQPIVAMPTAKPFIKHGKKQFWFYHNGKQLLAVQNSNNSFTA